MNPERRTLSRLALPLKVLADRFAFGALVILSLALLAVGKANVHLLEGVSTSHITAPYRPRPPDGQPR